jgi:hypothetical protein
MTARSTEGSEAAGKTARKTTAASARKTSAKTAPAAVARPLVRRRVRESGTHKDSFGGARRFHSGGVT